MPKEHMALHIGQRIRRWAQPELMKPHGGRTFGSR